MNESPETPAPAKGGSSRFPEINQVVLSGRLTRDPDFRLTQTGRAMARFDLAANRRWQNKTTGEWTEETTFVPVVAWAAAAEYCKETLKKGSPCKVEGRLRSREYEDKQGQKRKILEINAFKVEFIDVPKAARRSESVVADSAKTQAAGGEEDLEEVPF